MYRYQNKQDIFWNPAPTKYQSCADINRDYLLFSSLINPTTARSHGSSSTTRYDPNPCPVSAYSIPQAKCLLLAWMASPPNKRTWTPPPTRHASNVRRSRRATSTHFPPILHLLMSACLSSTGTGLGGKGRGAVA
jgi:hypothetical protein